ncbi:MAG TPA: peptidoglycan DD-metalloendopeptidase family protein [Actinomycetota bacterium]|nr:peptidoglycan DD-metalloendopeptidase family protein [Actinomycetota bacterium]
MSRLLRLSAAACVLALLAFGTPGAASTPRAVPAASGGSGTTSGSGSSQTADQMATFWNGFRTAQLQATALQAKITQETKQQNQLKGQIASYTSQIAAAQAQQAADTVQLTATDAQLASLEASIATTTAQVSDAQQQVQQRFVSLYKAGPASYLGLILGATSMNDFINRLNYVGSVVGSDKGKIDALKTLNDQLDAQKTQANQRKAQIAAEQAAVQAEGAKITALRASVSQASATLTSQIAAQKPELDQIQAQKAIYLQDMATLAGESSSITAMVRARQANQAYTWQGKKLIWPVHGAISSPFGPRINPIFGNNEFHTGIDIAVDMGVPILAAAPGQVMYAGVMQGYGNVVILDDGGALATLYAHMSVIGVHLGQTVKQGQQIGAVGCTGLCTGPHLHFETRVGGTPVQPLGFMP